MLAAIEAAIPALRRYARSLLREPQDADDLVHDTVVRAIANLDTKRQGAEIRPWLFTIMHNLFVSRLRKLKVRSRTTSLEDAPELDLATRGGQEGHVRWHEVMRALDELPEDQRTIIVLVCVESLSYAEVARLIGVPIGTVMSRLARARERLRILLQDDGEKPRLKRVK